MPAIVEQQSPPDPPRPPSEIALGTFDVIWIAPKQNDIVPVDEPQRVIFLPYSNITGSPEGDLYTSRFYMKWGLSIRYSISFTTKDRVESKIGGIFQKFINDSGTTLQVDDAGIWSWEWEPVDYLFPPEVPYNCYLSFEVKEENVQFARTWDFISPDFTFENDQYPEELRNGEGSITMTEAPAVTVFSNTSNENDLNGMGRTAVKADRSSPSVGMVGGAVGGALGGALLLVIIFGILYFKRRQGQDIKAAGLGIDDFRMEAKGDEVTGKRSTKGSVVELDGKPFSELDSTAFIEKGDGDEVR
ncbi:hypothetical protein BJ508DRAFT_326780 [Ascobolus immersus RN42]|uniref:Uncharacterized protein n=1 Tax=Ascobolus immersus RN42 TaxID=1160509 RepID=A0A3N4I9R4_ASCIM|nr:hypothetical protein BJ508DRAFT_326780 [Ascobolus immersus RN42]